MVDVISVDNMRRSDANTIASFVDSKELMWRASNGIYEESVKVNPNAFNGNTIIVVGSGNNGGDGFGLAVVLKKNGFNVRIISVTDHYSDDATYYKEIAEKEGVFVENFIPGTNQFISADTIVDCLLGTGFKGEVRGAYKTAIEEINSSSSYVISADINSGLDGDTGRAVLAVESSLTVTIGYHKKGILLARKSRYINKVSLTSIGIVLERHEDYLLNSSEWNEAGFEDLPYVVLDNGVTYFREDI